jgi:SAM-dependent methyltransferase
MADLSSSSGPRRRYADRAMPDAFTDRAFHRTAPVPDPGRPSIYAYREPRRDLLSHLFDRYIPLPAHGRVLDAGCGPGAYIPAVRARLASDALLVGLDLNHGRLRAVSRADVALVAADVASLPFEDATFDVVLAMHMLYHVPDIPRAVRELRRVLRPGTGVLHALTNSGHANGELTELYLRHGGGAAEAMGDHRFSNESGVALLRAAFAEDEIDLVELRDSWMAVRDPEAVVDELQRLRYTLEPGLRAGAVWDGMIAGARDEVRATVRDRGAFRISENHGLFTCRRTAG